MGTREAFATRDRRLALAFADFAVFIRRLVSGPELVDAESGVGLNFAGISIGSAAVLQENVFAGNVAGGGGAGGAAGD